MNNFENLGLKPQLLEAIVDMGFQSPTTIQEKAIPLLLAQQTDLIGLAQTGTGKTAAFGFPLLQHIEAQHNYTQGLILAPTRELCLQITHELQAYSKYLKKLSIVAIYGGASLREQERQIRKGAHIIVATPGRMKDMLNRNMIDISQIAYCVLDEADEMLNMGFYEDIVSILNYAPQRKQTWLFSATMPKEVSAIANDFMESPVEITVGQKNQATGNVSHEFYLVNTRDRYKAVKRLIDNNPDLFAVIFCRTKRNTQKVADHLIEHGYNAAALHGDLSQAQRDSVMKSFRLHQVQLLVATDVAARGIDVEDITHVIHYELPDDTEVYTHRSGRTGRAGKTGISASLITPKEKRRIKAIEHTIGQKFEQKNIPDPEEICKKQLFHRATEITNTPINQELNTHLPQLEELFQDLSKSELLKKVFSAEFSRFTDYYKNATDLNHSSPSHGNTGKDTRYFIGLGARDGFTWTSLKDLLREELDLDKNDIFKVDVLNNYSFFNTESSAEQKVLSSLKGFSFQGRAVQVEVTENKPHRKTQRKRRSSDRQRNQHRRKSRRSR